MRTLQVTNMITTNLFPYSSMPIRLEHSDSQKGSVTCFFQCVEHLEKYLEKNKINRKTCVIRSALEKISDSVINEFISILHDDSTSVSDAVPIEAPKVKKPRKTKKKTI